MLAVIIPCYNEQYNVGRVLDELTLLNSDTILVVVNDASTDLTSQKAKDTNKAFVIDLPINLGVGGAVQTGILKALRLNATQAVKFDGDCQHSSEYIKDLLKPILQNEADIVIGSRFLSEEPDGFKSSFFRKIGIKLLQVFTKILTGKVITDPTSGFRAYGSKAMNFMAVNYPNFDYPEPEEVVLAIKNDLKVLEVPVKMRERFAGKSSISALGSVYYMIKVMLAMFFIALRKHKKMD